MELLRCIFDDRTFQKAFEYFLYSYEGIRPLYTESDNRVIFEEKRTHRSALHYQWKGFGDTDFMFLSVNDLPSINFSSADKKHIVSVLKGQIYIFYITYRKIDFIERFIADFETHLQLSNLPYRYLFLWPPFKTYHWKRYHSGDNGIYN